MDFILINLDLTFYNKKTDRISSPFLLIHLYFVRSVVSTRLLLILIGLPVLHIYKFSLWNFPAFSHFFLSFCLCLSKQKDFKKPFRAPACCLRCLSAVVQSWNSFLPPSGHAARLHVCLFNQLSSWAEWVSPGKPAVINHSPSPLLARETVGKALTSSRFTPHPSRYRIQSPWRHVAQEYVV